MTPYSKTPRVNSFPEALSTIRQTSPVPAAIERLGATYSGRTEGSRYEWRFLEVSSRRQAVFLAQNQWFLSYLCR